jgi:hypothetical protein
MGEKQKSIHVERSNEKKNKGKKRGIKELF